MNDGLYRDQNGTIIGRQVGNSFMLSDTALASIRIDDTRSRSDAGATSIAIATTSEPKLCPDPVPDRPGDMKDRAVAYQLQVTGLPPGMAVELNGVMFDGCRTTDGTMLEAKGPGYDWGMSGSGQWHGWFRGIEKMLAQLKNQSDAAAGRLVEWHVAEPGLANYLQDYVQTNGYTNIVIIYTPAREK